MHPTVTHLQIEPTTRCNFTCGFCCGRHMAQSDLSFETFDATLDLMGDTLEHVELQGEGESLLHPQFFDMVRRLRARSVEVSFISNGSMLSTKNIEQILDSEITKISVSIESPDAAQFQKIRGGKFEKVVRNLEALLAARHAAGRVKPVVGFSVTVLKSTLHQLPDIFDLYARIGLDGGITLQPLQPMAGYTQHYNTHVAHEALDALTAHRVTMAPFEDHAVRKINAQRAPIDGFYESLMAGWRPASKRCPYLERGLYIDRDGQATPCCMIKADHGGALGQIVQTPLSEILQKREDMRQTLAGGEIPSPCKGCFIAEQSVKSHHDLLRLAAEGLLRRWSHRGVSSLATIPAEHQPEHQPERLESP